ncbi:unnamed protein product [Sphagnum jensenii]|uniref:Uncharacterized protein n=1 Tax=Sphagnum jensenii TaxID=128206 RepID=A0ABP1ATM8_9BRYO
MNEGRDARGWTRWGPVDADRDHRDARESASGSGRGGVAAAPPVRAVDAGLRWWRTRALPPLLLPSPAHTQAGPPPPPPPDQSVPPSS